MFSNFIIALILIVVVLIVLLVAAPGLLKSLSDWLKNIFHRKKPGKEAPTTGKGTKSSTSPPPARENHRENEVGGYSYIQSEISRGTLILPQIAVEQLDPRGQRVVHTFFVCDIPESGISISRPDAKKGEIKLIAYNEIARSVSENHLTIGLDEKGYFWVNKNGEVITIYNKMKTACHDIKDGDTLYLGTGYQPIRIRILTPEIYQELLSRIERGNSMDERDRRTQFFNGGAPVNDLRRRFRQMGGEE